LFITVELRELFYGIDELNPAFYFTETEIPAFMPLQTFFT
jgi:hypothetical protein